MGRATKLTFKGVVARKASIRIWFMWRENRQWETLKMLPTPANLKHASRLREEICTRIAIGAFDYAEFFPDSEYAKTQCEEKAGPTFREAAEKWLSTISGHASSTLYDYRKRLNRHIYPVIGEKPIREIVYGDLATLLGNIKWNKMKTRNNTTTPIRQTFELAFLDGIIETNPATRLRNVKSQKVPPDPFSLEEVNALCAKLQEQSPAYGNYFEFAFFSGLRTSELLALRWDAVDWNLGLVRVNQAKVDGETKDTKSAKVRDIELNSRALEALKRQKGLTFLAGKEVFINPNTGEAIGDENIVRSSWIRALKACGIRYRKPYQTRHTFATMNLMAGANPMWVSRQMGHTSMKMLLEVYARWIDMADRSRERNKLEALLSVPNVCQTKNGAA